MRVLHVSAAAQDGGAARAAHRLHCALHSTGSIDSEMLVAANGGREPRVQSLERSSVFRTAMDVVRRVLDQEVRLARTTNRVFRSPARIPTLAPHRVRVHDPDVLILHWLGSRMMSISQIGQINRPTAWVLHDSWTFCGSEHHPHGEEDRRFIDGYSRYNKMKGEWGVDVNRQVWERKKKHWVRPMHLVAPSSWMAEQASRSALVADWPVTVIPNPLDVAWWGGLQRAEARKRLQINFDSPVLLYGARGGDGNPGKGADLLYSSLRELPAQHGLATNRPLEILSFGGRPGLRRVGPHTVRSVGYLDDEGLRDYYSAADVMVVPSRMDNLPQTAVEAISCGTPVVAFRTGGLPDIVDDGINGRLAEPFSPQSLAKAIGWVLESPERHRRLSEAARATASRWDPVRIAKRYVALFEEMLER